MKRIWTATKKVEDTRLDTVDGLIEILKELRTYYQVLRKRVFIVVNLKKDRDGDHKVFFEA